MEPLGASWAVLEPLFSMLAFGVVFKSALGGIWVGFLRDFKGFGTDFGRVLGGLGRNFRAFWVILVHYRLFSMIGLFLADLCKIFAGAPCCLLLLSWRLSSKSVLAFASYCLLGHAFAP